MTTTLSTAYWLDLHRQATEAVRPVYARIQRDHLNHPTPCTDWNLGQLLDHMVGQDHGFAAAARADVGVEAFHPLPVGADLAARLSASVTGTHESFAQADPDRLILMPEFGMQRFPLVAVIGFHFIDTLVHGWDVAATIGQSVDYDRELAAAALTQARGVPDGPFRSDPGSPFGQPLLGAHEAEPWTQTLRWLGRDPEWTGNQNSATSHSASPVDAPYRSPSDGD
jgi:uncharacterized protein (TIGR03086 family)